MAPLTALLLLPLKFLLLALPFSLLKLLVGTIYVILLPLRMLLFPLRLLLFPLRLLLLPSTLILPLLNLPLHLLSALLPGVPIPTPLVILFLVLGAYCWRERVKRGRDDVRNLPGPPTTLASPLWGHELLVFSHEIGAMHSLWVHTYGSRSEGSEGEGEKSEGEGGSEGGFGYGLGFGCFRIKGALGFGDILIPSPHCTSHILSLPNTYRKSPAFRRPIAEIMGKGLAWAEGGEHLYMRRVLGGCFSQESIRGMWSDIAECAEKLEARLINVVLLGAGEASGVGGANRKYLAGITLNMVEYTRMATLDIIGRVAFGHDFKATVSGPSTVPNPDPNTSTTSGTTPLSSPSSPHFPCTYPYPTPPPFPTTPPTDATLIATSWTSLVQSGLTFAGFVAPLIVRGFPLVGLLLTWVPVSVVRERGVIRGVVRRLAGRLVERERERERVGEREWVVERERVGEREWVVESKGGDGGKGGGGKESGGDDILSILMRARREGKDGVGLTDEQILDNISTFTMVGHETTAGSLNMTLWQLARHPEIQARLREEIRAKGRDLSYDDVQKLEFLDAVVKEGLRLHPATSQTERVAMQDDVIPLGKPVRGVDGRMMTSIRVRKGQVIHIPFVTMQTSPAIWGPDASVFNPQRWLPTMPDGSPTPTSLRVPEPSALPHGWSGLLVFCDGPRNCIGWRLALLEFKVILATLIRSLEFHDTGAVVLQKMSPTLQPVVDGKGGVLPLHISLAS